MSVTISDGIIAEARSAAAVGRPLDASDAEEASVPTVGALSSVGAVDTDSAAAAAVENAATQRAIMNSVPWGEMARVFTGCPL